MDRDMKFQAAAIIILVVGLACFLIVTPTPQTDVTPVDEVIEERSTITITNNGGISDTLFISFGEAGALGILGGEWVEYRYDVLDGGIIYIKGE